MSMPFYVSPEQMMEDRADYARKGIARGRALIAVSFKNGILIVEFANQLRDRGKEIGEAIIEAASLRLRPILMTSITTVAGSIPLIISSGAGAETRYVLGITLLFGVSIATFLSLFVVPVAYNLLARFSPPPGETAQKLARQLENL